MRNMVKIAEQIATIAHKGQVRKFSGDDYITHPRAVSKKVRGRDRIAAAWLHDVVEDTSTTLDDLRLLFPERIVVAVDCLTKRDGENYNDFVDRAMVNEIAIHVKIADIEHNMATIPEGHGLLDRWAVALKKLKGCRR